MRLHRVDQPSLPPLKPVHARRAHRTPRGRAGRRQVGHLANSHTASRISFPPAAPTAAEQPSLNSAVATCHILKRTQVNPLCLSRSNPIACTRANRLITRRGCTKASTRTGSEPWPACTAAGGLTTRPLGQAGGVCIMIEKMIPYYKTHCDANDSVESVAVDVMFGSRKYRFVNVYRPSSHGAYEKLHAKELMNSVKWPVTVVGDLNCPDVNWRDSISPCDGVQDKYLTVFANLVWSS